LAAGDPAAYAGLIDLPQLGVRVVTASPELYLRRRADTITSGPTKGTAKNTMIVDSVRNGFSRVASVGSVSVPELCVVEKYPGSVHLVSTVQARLEPDTGWARILDAAFPPGSVSDAPRPHP
jgi:para-aminobenzoate synthetase component I